jgi:hypothetical protein
VLALLLCVAVGAAIYAGSLYLLWRMSGRPDGAERACLDRAGAAVRKLGLRLNLV